MLLIDDGLIASLEALELLRFAPEDLGDDDAVHPLAHVPHDLVD